MKIKNILDFENAEAKLNLKKIPANEIKVVSVDNFWDGPLSGECTWLGRNYYFECFDQVDSKTDSDVWPRKYLLLSLTEDQKKENQRLQKLFEKSAESDELKKEYIRIFEEAPEHIVERNQIIGWFDSSKPLS